jgi:hypothetical protein
LGRFEFISHASSGAWPLIDARLDRSGRATEEILSFRSSLCISYKSLVECLLAMGLALEDGCLIEAKERRSIVSCKLRLWVLDVMVRFDNLSKVK